MAKNTNTPKRKPADSLCMRDPDLFRALRDAFARRGYDGLSLTSMIRIALREWIKRSK